MHHAPFRVDIEVNVNLRTPRVRVRWHGVPHGAFLQFGEAHDKLAALDAVGMNIFVNRAAVCIGERTEFDRRGIFHRGQRRRIRRMRRVAEEIKCRGLRGILARERNFPAATANVEAVEFVHLVFFSVDFHCAAAANVQDAQLAALAEKRGAQFGIGTEFQRGTSRDRRADDGAIGVAVNEFDFARDKQRLDEEIGAQPVGAKFCVIVLIR